MKAMIYDHYGDPDVLHPAEIDRPVPKAHEVLIKVHATSVTAADYRARALDVPPGFGLPARLTFGLRKPRNPVLGVELAGEVVEVGSKVSRFRIGDQVFGTNLHMGGYAEYAVRDERSALARMPDNMSYEESAAIAFGAQTALYYLRDIGHIQTGDKVLVYGASGGVGTAAVQLARYFGAEVTGVTSTANLELVRSLGADRVIDYTERDYTATGEQYDLIIDTVGKTSFEHARSALKPDGKYLAVAGGMHEYLLQAWTAIKRGQRVRCSVARERVEDLEFIRDLVEAGRYQPAIDRSYPFEQLPEAHAYASRGHKRGNVVVSLE